MSDVAWVRIVSWHIVRAVAQTYPTVKVWTLCGRDGDRWSMGKVVQDLPGGEKTCETCLRVQVVREEWGRG